MIKIRNLIILGIIVISIGLMLLEHVNDTRKKEIDEQKQYIKATYKEIK
ncbi:hypothetical protein [Clostridium sardiniense]